MGRGGAGIRERRAGTGPSLRAKVLPMSPRSSETFDVLAIGDVHCHYGLVRRICRREAVRAPYAHVFTVGDFSDTKKEYVHEDPEQVRGIDIWRCHGNHEVWTELERLPGTYVRDGEVRTTKAPALRVLAFGGVYSPAVWERDPRGLKGPDRRAFTRAEFEQAKHHKDVDVLLTHETGAHVPNFFTSDRGQLIVRELVEATRPRLHLQGHHHHLTVAHYGPTIALMLPIPTTGWARIHYENGRPAAYSVSKMVGKSFIAVAERLPFPEDGHARVGMPDNERFHEAAVGAQLARPPR